MKKACTISVLCALFMVAASSQSLPEQDGAPPSLPAKSSYVFRVPVFPGTQLFEGNPGSAELIPPIGTITEVYRTTDGRPLDKEAVISFYRDALGHKGWKEWHKEETYLSMHTNIFEDHDGTRIQVAGDFYLWVAPLDGMIIVYQKQWRISSPGQATYNAVQAMIKRLEEAAPKAGYRTQKVESDGGWKTDFENEYLVNRVLYALIPADEPAGMDAPPGTLIVSLLSYRDAEIAADEKARRGRERPFLCSHSSVAVKNKIVVTIEGRAAKEKRAAVLNAITGPERSFLRSWQ